MSILDFLTSTKTFEVNHKGVGLLFHVKRKEKKITAAIDISKRHSGAQPLIIDWVKQSFEPEFIQVVDFKTDVDLVSFIPGDQNFEAVQHTKYERAKFITSIVNSGIDKRILNTEEKLVFTFTPEPSIMFEDVSFDAHTKIVAFINSVLNNTEIERLFPLTSLSVLKECYDICQSRDFRSLDERPPTWRLSSPSSQGIFLSNQINELSCLDFHSSNINSNAIVAFGTTLQSKHFNSEIITNALSRNGKVVVIEKNNDFFHMAKVLNGQINTVSPKFDSINPFWGVKLSRSSLEKLTLFMEILAKQSRSISIEEKQTISTSIEKAFKSYGNEVDLTKVVQQFKKTNTELAKIFDLFTTGEYSNLFNGQPSFDCKNALTIFEISDCFSSQLLHRASTAAIIALSFIALNSDPNSQNQLFINEADSIIKDDDFINLIEQISTSSPYNKISTIAAVNHASSIANTKTINTFYNNAIWTLIGKVTNDDLSVLENANIFEDSEFLKMARSTLLRQDKYIDIAVRFGNSSGKFKYYIDPSSYALFSCVQKYKMMLDDYMSTYSTKEAISTVATIIRDKQIDLFEN